ncbi:MAG: bifunctional riboflavin kinase/FAD synthetase [Bryobacteraceae bacterium]
MTGSGKLEVFRTLEEARGRFAPSALSIGNFDGVHRGHQELFQRLVARCRAEGSWKPSVLTFHPHPAKVIKPERAPRLLTDISQRLVKMRDCGIEQVLALPFTPEFSRLTPEEFARQVLVEAAGARLVVVGENFRFGAKQAGDVRLLGELGAGLGFATDIARGVVYRGTLVSSTEVRSRVERGDVRMANRFLGRPYALEGAVVSGHGVGSKQTVPTLNLATDAEVLPARGVYVTRVSDLASDRAWPAVTNVGFRPTFQGDRLTIESFLLEGYSDPAPGRIRVEFLWRLRDERKFDSPEALKSQILRDVMRAKRYFARLRRAAPL